jgi:hypothetical protein
VLLRAFLVGLVLTATTAAGLAPSASAAAPDPTSPPVSVNPFIPEDRSISECVSALPKPGCGSEERGGVHQYLVLAALVGGLSFVGWRIVAGTRRNRPTPPSPAPPA